jgi:hypothetical protein
MSYADLLVPTMLVLTFTVPVAYDALYYVLDSIEPYLLQFEYRLRRGVTAKTPN